MFVKFNKQTYCTPVDMLATIFDIYTVPFRPDRSPPVHYAETSMKNGFGLKYIHKFLNLPFLLLQVSM